MIVLIDTMTKRDKVMYILGLSAISFDAKYFAGKNHKQIMDDLKAEFEWKLGLAGEEISDALYDTNESLFPEEFLGRLIEEINKSLKVDDMIRIERATITAPSEIKTTDE